MHNKISILGLILALFVHTAVLAAEDLLRPDHPDRYVVVEGDTLWGISGQFLRDPWLWPEIWHANPQIENPHLIYPGDVITLVYIDGKPRLQVSRGKPTVKLSPEVRETPLHRAIPTVSLDAIRPFLTEPWVVSEAELEGAAYMVQSAGEHLIVGAGDRIYARRIADPAVKRYSIVRGGEPYVDPVTEEVLGIEARYVGDARLQRSGDPATLEVTRSSVEALIGDRLLPASGDSFDANFHPRAPQQSIEGQIIDVLGGVTQIGRFAVVVINRGEREGMEPGHVLSIWQRGELVPDQVTDDRKDMVQLPDEHAGLLMVFRTFNKVSFALVMRANTNIRVLDAVRNP